MEAKEQRNILEEQAMSVNAVHQSATWETQDDGKIEDRLATQDSHHQSNSEARDGSIAVGNSEEEDADQLREHDGKGQVCAQDPEGHDMAVQVRQRGSHNPHDQYGDVNHPWQLSVRGLQRKS